MKISLEVVSSDHRDLMSEDDVVKAGLVGKLVEMGVGFLGGILESHSEKNKRARVVSAIEDFKKGLASADGFVIDASWLEGQKAKIRANDIPKDFEDRFDQVFTIGKNVSAVLIGLL